MNYKTYPTDYIQQLKVERKEEGRRKARSFMEYWDDMEHGDHNSEGFYARSWKCSRSTAHDWIIEFKKEIDLFLDHWTLRNNQHYSYAKKSTEQNEQIQPSKITRSIASNIGVFEDTAEQTEQNQPREALNLNNNNNGAELFYYNDPQFNDLFFIYGMNTKFKGKKEEAYEAYKKVSVDHDLLKLAVVHYLHDRSIGEKRYNLTNFLKNDIYVAYMPKRLEIMIDGVWMAGVYDDKRKVFAADGGFTGGLSAERLVELFSKDELRFINTMEKVG